MRVDAAIVGGGIVGLSAALLLAREGASVALVEGRQIAEGVTGNTTAKVTSLHGLSYASLRSKHGPEVAAAYGEANESGLATIAALVDELGIECDLRRRPNFTYTEDPSERSQIEDEVEAALEAGLPASYAESLDLPFPVAGAVRFDDQAEFHPVRYATGIAAAAEAEGARIFEWTRATGLDGTTVLTAAGHRIEAQWVIVATHLPFLDRGLYFARSHPERSYAFGVRLDGQVPQGMYLSTEKPGHSIRAHPAGDEEILIVGGESHKPGTGDPSERFRTLERYARERFPVRSIEYRWAAHDHIPIDGLPYVGRVWPPSERVLTVTGLRKWGLAMGTTAATILADGIAGRRNPWAATFDASRLPPARSLPSAAEHGLFTARHLVGDRLRRHGSGDELQPGQGAVVGSGLGQRAVYRDDSGVVHELSARCTHMGCIVDWNSAELTWDCPCHGSRFGPRGDVLSGPATAPLAEKSAD
jgi:glycine/D-amino acid oxidase-like deaminating enzyme/nitrite reductase/ring-hydroxylating ferredoxin subunit